MGHEQPGQGAGQEEAGEAKANVDTVDYDPPVRGGGGPREREQE